MQLSTRWRRRTRHAALLAATAAIGLPAVAHANNVTLGDGLLTYSQTTSKDSAVVVRNVGSEVQVESSTGIATVPSLCRRVGLNVVGCPTGQIVRIQVLMGDGADSYVSRTHIPTLLFGFGGADTYAGPGHSLINKVEFFGGVGHDTADYSIAARGVVVDSADGLATDGRPGLDQDNIRGDVEGLVGTIFADTLFGSLGNDLIRGNAGNDIMGGNSGNDMILESALPDGADFINGGSGVDTVNYQLRTSGVVVTLDALANDGAPGEGDDVRPSIESIVGSQFSDRLIGNNLGNSILGFAGDDTIEGRGGNDTLQGDAGKDTVLGQDHDDVLFTRDGESDIAGCGAGSDTAHLDSRDGFDGCETRPVGVLRLGPNAVAAEARKTARLQLTWRHPRAWRNLRTVQLRLTRDNVPVGEITIRPQGDRITADGAVELVRKQTRLATKGKTVTANLAVRLDGSLAGQTLDVEVEATDTRGHRQLERDAGTVRVAP